MGSIRRWLQHRLTRDLSVDDPRTTARRCEIIQSKPFLRRVYLDWYRRVRDSLPPGPGAVLELGSGAGFLRELVPEVVTSEVFPCPGVQLIADGQRLPIAEGRLRAIVMVDVLHHLPDCHRFFIEAARCIRPGGVIVAIEPWVSPWSRLIYSRLHHEPFRPDSLEWEFPSSGPLSGSNQALPWIVFERDRAILEKTHPQWCVAQVHPFMPLLYLVSGGVGLRSLAPGWTYSLVAGLERLLESIMRNRLAMFAHIVVERTEVAL